jgi:hypothetical protein
MMFRTFVLAAAALAAASAAAPACAGGGLSWAKPNVAYAEYRLDAAQCSNAAYDAPISYAPIDDIARATRGMAGDSIYNFARAQQVFIHGVGMELRDQLQNAVDRCLVERGYRLFRLTDEQRRALARLRRNSAERQHYLHGLAADPAVAAQGVPTLIPPAPRPEPPRPRKEPMRIIDLDPVPA